MLSETALLARAEDAIAGLLPDGWSCSRRDAPAETDLLLTIRSPDGATCTVAVEVKQRVAPGNVDAVVAQLARAAPAAALVVAAWLSPLTRAALTEAGVGYVDLTGNADVRLSRPGLVLRTTGAAKDPEPAPSALGSLKGPGAARAVRALVDFAPPYGVRELAKVSGASAPVLSRVAALLASDALLRRDARGTMVDVSWVDVLRRWVEDYRFPGTERGVRYLDPRGIAAFTRKLATYGRPWAATGTLGVPPGVAVAPVTLATVYVESPERAAREMGLTPADTGANVLLIGVGESDERARAVAGDDGVVRCAPSQIAADLLTGPGRGSSEGEALIAWMRANESSWRKRP